MARLIIGVGIALVAVGIVLLFGGRLGLGRLPGDIAFKRGNTEFYFPIVTSIAISIAATVLLNLAARWRR